MSKIPKNIQDLKNEAAYFDAKQTVYSKPKYVAWLDMMGSSSTLARSTDIASIHIGKFHSAILRAKSDTRFKGNLYPMVDGCYITSENGKPVLNLLKAVFRSLALTFIFETEPKYRFMVRGSLAYGKVIAGENIRNCSLQFAEEPAFVESILFGHPLAVAFHDESSAPPFGLWVEQSARQTHDVNAIQLPITYWPWWKYETEIDSTDKYCDQIEVLLAKALSDHFKSCEKLSLALPYPKEAIARHREAARQYFDDWPDED
jgi:hypothetical protein